MRVREVSSIRPAWALAAGALTASAGVCGEQARRHLAELGTLCGGGFEAAHCGWCYAGVAFGLAGLSALVAALRPQLAPAAPR